LLWGSFLGGKEAPLRRRMRLRDLGVATGKTGKSQRLAADLVQKFT
jgi:hypothetical protein